MHLSYHYLHFIATKSNNLKTFALNVSGHLYCAQSLRRATSSIRVRIQEEMRDENHWRPFYYIAVHGFISLKWSVILGFLSIDQILYQLSTPKFEFLNFSAHG